MKTEGYSGKVDERNSSITFVNGTKRNIQRYVTEVLEEAEGEN